MTTEKIVTTKQLGSVTISAEVIAVIAALASGEIKGVAGMCGNWGNEINEKLGRRNLSKGIKIEIEENSVCADVNIIIDYGVSIQDVAAKVQDNVRRNIENMTDLKVKEINVHVNDLRIKQSESSN